MEGVRKQPGVLPPQPAQNPWIKTSTFVVGLGIFLGVVGASLLLGFGLAYVKPYMDVKNMRSGQCAVTLAANEEPFVTCACGRDAGSCHSKYPCLKILVNMTVQMEDITLGASNSIGVESRTEPSVADSARNQSEELPMVVSDSHQHVTIYNVTLYDSYETFQLQHEARKVNVTSVQKGFEISRAHREQRISTCRKKAALLCLVLPCHGFTNPLYHWHPDLMWAK